MKGYPRWFSKAFVNSIALSAFITGLLLLPNTFQNRFAWKISINAFAASRVWIVALHLLGGFSLVWVLGALSVIHMRSGWIRQKKIASGLSLVTVMLLLTITGIGILYFGDENLSLLSTASHVFLGLLLLGFYLLHVFISSTKN